MLALVDHQTMPRTCLASPAGLERFSGIEKRKAAY